MPNLIADTMDCGLSYSVISYLKKLSQQVNTPAHVLLISFTSSVISIDVIVEKPPAVIHSQCVKLSWSTR